MADFTSYFLKEWRYHDGVWSHWSRWQLFQTPAGVATTNNCLESFNKQIKQVYTQYKVGSVYIFLLIVLQKLINQQSYQPKEFCMYRSPEFEVIKKANEIVDSGIHFLAKDDK